MPAPAEPDGRPKIRDILTDDEMEGMASDAGMSEEQIAKVAAPMSGMSVGQFQMVAAAGRALGEKLGMKSNSAAELSLACSYTAAVRALVFALSSCGYGLTTAFDTPAGAYFEAELPSDLLAYGGSLQFDVVEQGENAVQLKGASEIPGQMYDWGKGKRALAAVFEKTEAFARRLDD